MHQSFYYKSSVNENFAASCEDEWKWKQEKLNAYLNTTSDQSSLQARILIVHFPQVTLRSYFWIEHLKYILKNLSTISLMYQTLHDYTICRENHSCTISMKKIQAIDNNFKLREKTISNMNEKYLISQEPACLLQQKLAHSGSKLYSKSLVHEMLFLSLLYPIF